jgi:aconitate hydratase
VLLVVGDNVTTDHILPAGARVLPLRSNIPAIAEFTFERVDPSFPARAKAWGGGFVVAGANYGQGSSREHAALAPMYLGVRAVIAKTFARIHRANLINFGILPLTLVDPADYTFFQQGDELQVPGATELLTRDILSIRHPASGREIAVRHGLTPRQAGIIRAGGLLNHIRGARSPLQRENPVPPAGSPGIGKPMGAYVTEAKR